MNFIGIGIHWFNINETPNGNLRELSMNYTLIFAIGSCILYGFMIYLWDKIKFKAHRFNSRVNILSSFFFLLTLKIFL